MKRSIMALLPLLFPMTGSWANALEPVSWSANGHWYQRRDMPGIRWSAAKAEAEASTYRGLAGHLVTITSADENLFITQHPSLGDGSNDRLNRHWIGGYQPEGSPEPDGGWQWVTGEPFSFQNWASGGGLSEPNNAFPGENAILFDHRFSDAGKHWNDAPDNYAMREGYVIEFDELAGGQTVTNTAPVITRQPQSQWVEMGSAMTLTVVAEGTAPLSYHWQFNGVEMAGATNAVYGIPSIQASQFGEYVVVVSNGSGSVTSQPAPIRSLPGIEWDQSFGGKGREELIDLEPTSDGGFVLGGISCSPPSGNRTSPKYAEGEYGEDYWVVRLDAKGNKLWDKAFGGKKNQRLRDLQPTADGLYSGRKLEFAAERQ